MIELDRIRGGEVGAAAIHRIAEREGVEPGSRILRLQVVARVEADLHVGRVGRHRDRRTGQSPEGGGGVVQAEDGVGRGRRRHRGRDPAVGGAARAQVEVAPAGGQGGRGDAVEVLGEQGLARRDDPGGKRELDLGRRHPRGGDVEKEAGVRATGIVVRQPDEIGTAGRGRGPRCERGVGLVGGVDGDSGGERRQCPGDAGERAAPDVLERDGQVGGFPRHEGPVVRGAAEVREGDGSRAHAQRGDLHRVRDRGHQRVRPTPERRGSPEPGEGGPGRAPGGRVDVIALVGRGVVVAGLVVERGGRDGDRRRPARAEGGREGVEQVGEVVDAAPGRLVVPEDVHAPVGRGGDGRKDLGPVAPVEHVEGDRGGEARGVVRGAAIVDVAEVAGRRPVHRGRVDQLHAVIRGIDGQAGEAVEAIEPVRREHLAEGRQGGSRVPARAVVGRARDRDGRRPGLPRHVDVRAVWIAGHDRALASGAELERGRPRDPSVIGVSDLHGVGPGGGESGPRHEQPAGLGIDRAPLLVLEGVGGAGGRGDLEGAAPRGAAVGRAVDAEAHLDRVGGEDRRVVEDGRAGGRLVDGEHRIAEHGASRRRGELAAVREGLAPVARVDDSADARQDVALGSAEVVEADDHERSGSRDRRLALDVGDRDGPVLRVRLCPAAGTRDRRQGRRGPVEGQAGERGRDPGCEGQPCRARGREREGDERAEAQGRARRLAEPTASAHGVLLGPYPEHCVREESRADGLAAA